MRISAIVALSVLFSATYLVAQPHSVQEIQFTESPDGISPFNGQTVEVTGLISGYGFSTGNLQYFLCDAGGGPWSGILIAETAPRALAIGDSIVLRGQVAETGGQTRLNSPEILSGPTPGTATIGIAPATTGGIGEAHEGVLVEISSPVVTDVFATGFQINDGTGSLRVRKGFNFENAPIIGDTLQYLRGIIAFSSNEFSLNPRSDQDFGFTSNRPPLISNVNFTPDLPSGATPVTVTAVITDDNNAIGEVFVYYRFTASGDFAAVSMHDDGTHGDGAADDDTWGGILPAGPERSTASFYVSARDQEGLRALSPENAPASTYTYFIRTIDISIFNIQFTGSPIGGDSPYKDSVVTVAGIVTGSGFDDRNSFYMSDPGGGPWSGVYVYSPPTAVVPGDCVRVRAVVQEFNGITELSSVVSATVLGTGVVPPPDTIRTSILPDSAEAYEGGFVYIGTSVVTSISSYNQYGQWNVTDGSGDGVILDDLRQLEYVPEVGDSVTFIRGCVAYNSNPGHMIAPRNDADVGFIDRRPPEVQSVVTVSEHLVNMRFNERIDPTVVSDLTRFEIIEVTDPNFPTLHIVFGQLFSDGRTVQLETLESMPEDAAYQVNMSDIRDLAGNSLTEASFGFGGFVATQVVQIADIYSNYAAYDTNIVTLRGVVNFVQDVTTSSGSRRISAFIQDESGRGFNLSQTGAAATFPGIIRGNLIEITGRVNVFSNAIQMGEFAAGANSADVRVLAENQDLPAPIEIRTGDLRTQASIVRVSDPGLSGSGTWCKATGTIYQVDENVGGGTNIFLDDGSGNLTVRVWDSMYLDSVHVGDEWIQLGDLVGHRVSIAGPSSTFNGDFQMLAGYADDFTDPNPAGAPSGDLVLTVPNKAFAPDIGQTFPIYVDSPPTGAARLRLFNLRGQLVHTFVDKRAGGPQFIDWDGRNDLKELVPIGTYILHLESIKNGETESLTKPVVVGTRL